MRRHGFAAATALLALCLALVGCFGGGTKSSSPLDDAVGYFAKDAPFVAAIETDPNGDQVKQLESLAGQLPVASLLVPRIERTADISFVNWSRDVRPQLGAPIVVGLVRPAAGSGIGTATLLAWRINHPLRAKQVILRQPDFRGGSKISGVRIYYNAANNRFLAVDGHVVLEASDRDILGHAIEIRRTDNRMRASDFERDMRGLPSAGVVRISAAPGQLIGADPRLRPALGLRWLAALRRAGVVIAASPSGITLDFRVATDPATLTDADLPLAPRSGPLPLIGKSGEVQIGIRDPSRLARLAIAVWQKVAPAAVRRFRSLEPRGVDLERQLPRHLADLAVLSFNPQTRAFALRARLHQSNDVANALAKLAPALPQLAAVLGFKGLGVAAPAAGERFYAVASPAARTVVFGVVGDSIVAASDARRAADLASEPTHFAPGAHGAAVLTTNARQLAARFIAARLGGVAALFAPLAVSSLHDLTGAITINRDALSGHFKLAIVR